MSLRLPRFVDLCGLRRREHLATGEFFQHPDRPADIFLAEAFGDGSLIELPRDGGERHRNVEVRGLRKHQLHILLKPLDGEARLKVGLQDKRYLEGDQPGLSGAVLEYLQHQFRRDAGLGAEDETSVERGVPQKRNSGIFMRSVVQVDVK